MTNRAMTFLEDQHHREDERRQSIECSGPQHAIRLATRQEAALPSRSNSTASEDDEDIQSDLVPSANTFIRKLFQMVTSENNDIISFTPGTVSISIRQENVASFPPSLFLHT
jgi:hypothetical protein